MAKVLFIIAILSLTFLSTLNDDTITGLTTTFITKLLGDTITSMSQNITTECFDNLTLMINDKQNLYTTKFMRDSAKNLNDVGNYKNCYYTSYNLGNNTYTSIIKDNLTYIVFNIENNDMTVLKDITDIRYEANNFMLGSCLIHGCSKDDLKLLFYTISGKLAIFDNLKYNDINVLDIEDGQVSLSFLTALKVSPFLFIIALIIFSLYPPIAVRVFKCCFRKSQKKIEVEKKESSENKLVKLSDFWSSEFKNTLTDKCKLTTFQNCFDMTENSNSLMTNELKDSGVNIINGFRAITIIFTIVGIIFRVLYQSPIKIFCQTTFKHMVTSYSFSLILFGRRFGPPLLFSFSAYILIFKLLSYLDDVVDVLEDKAKYEGK
jgi:hypothetical protein